MAVRLGHPDGGAARASRLYCRKKQKNPPKARKREQCTKTKAHNNHKYSGYANLVRTGPTTRPRLPVTVMLLDPYPGVGVVFVLGPRHYKKERGNPIPKSGDFLLFHFSRVCTKPNIEINKKISNRLVDKRAIYATFQKKLVRTLMHQGLNGLDLSHRTH